jgi:glycosyltransferase involved in cell wall biosynthesis
MPLHVAFNAQKLFTSHDYRNAGISKYIRQLLSHLPLADPAGRYTIFTHNEMAGLDWLWSGPAAPLAHGRFTVRRARLPTTSPPVRILWEQSLLPLEAARAGAQVLHSPLNVVPLAAPCPTVVTIHDLTFLLFPDRFSRAKRTYLRLFTALTVHRACLVLADSESTRRDILRFFRIPASKVRVVYPGVDPEFVPLAGGRAEAAARLGVPQPLVLYVGTLEPRKNVDTLVRAFARVRRRTGLPHRLALVGGKGWMYEQIFRAIEDEALGDAVVLPGYVPGDRLPLWYNAADLFVYPSQYEGFGFPPLEAMACGTPVITSTTSSLPEVVGDAGITVQPNDVEALATAMERVLMNPALAQEMRARGLIRASSFSWMATARECVRAYHDAAAQHAAPVPAV